MQNETESHVSSPPIDNPTFLTQIPFTDFQLPQQVVDGLQAAGFSYCTPIQAQTLAISLSGRDVAGQAQTGTGKTAAFLITIFSRLIQLKLAKGEFPTVLIVAPTRELASQIFAEARVIGKYTHYRMTQVLGGVDYQKQAQTLKEGVDIVICTPGRIIDYMKQGVFKPEQIKMVVIDEADRLLDLGFAKDMRYILSHLPHYESRQSMLFSATLSYHVLELTYEYMNLPEFIAVSTQDIAVERINQVLYHVGLESKISLLLGILKQEDWSRILIFVNTKAGVEWLTLKLKGNGWPVEGITGDLHQRKRFRLMEQFKNGHIKILVATDVASRGIHVEDISHVINFDLPQDADSYIHRIGRTARAGRSGKAISLACERYVYHLEPLEERLGYKIPVVWPDERALEKDACGPVCMATKGRKGKSARGRDRTKKRLERLKRPGKEWKQEHPGAFFGFPPPPKPTSTPKPTSGGRPPSKSKSKRRHGRKRPAGKPPSPATPSPKPVDDG